MRVPFLGVGASVPAGVGDGYGEGHGGGGEEGEEGEAVGEGHDGEVLVGLYVGVKERWVTG